ncbi:MAG TPA: excinuclease ABC subunit UvrC [Terriglobales bacterium]|nr:excinuclease ABC subunit UvrC [Terriglobales bacterium]
MDLQVKLENLPTQPGVYLLKDEDGKIIYVGKAKSLKNRVKSYFQSGVEHPRTQALVSRIKDFEILVTDSEMEALILESNLIKEHKPRYNVNLKDDKRYPYVKVTVDEPFPRILVVRRPKKDKAKYFGPYTNAKGMRQSLRLLRKLFPVRSCNHQLPSKRKIRVCLDFHIKRCQGPCEGLVSEKEYREMIETVLLFLAGKNKVLIDELKRRMSRLAEEESFEEAARVRDQLKAVESMMQRQKVVEREIIDRDIIAFARDGSDVCMATLQVRDGVLIGRQHFYLRAGKDVSDAEVLNSFLKQYYMNAAIIPQQVILPLEVEDKDIIQKWLNERSEKKVELIIPQKGEKAGLLNLATQNAQLLLMELLIQKKKIKKTVPPSVIALKKDLYLTTFPRQIVAFDISNLGPSDAVGSLVFFEDARPKKSEYRKFKIKTVEGQDDFAMMEEVVRRYFYRLLEEKIKLPDLVLIDGGKGQLSSALKVLNEMGIKEINVIGLAKRLDEIFLPGKESSLMIPRSSSSLRLLQRIRDEAHRFAITYHRGLREKKIVTSELDELDGIGKIRKKALLLKFGSVEAIKGASLDELSNTEKITKNVAEKVYLYFHKD